MGVGDDVMRLGLADFAGVRRRFTKTGVVDGITVVDDYGHHPVEIAAVLKAARTGTRGKVVAIVQPHRYSRLAALFEDFCTCFNDADAVLVADVYAAGEEPIEGIDRDALVAGLLAHGHRAAMALKDEDDLARMVEQLAAHPWSEAELDELVAPRFGIITGFQGLLTELEALRRLDLGEIPPAGPLRFTKPGS